MPIRTDEKKYLSTKGLLNSTKNYFNKVQSMQEKQGTQKISITDCLMSILAIFKLKFDWLEFEEYKKEEHFEQNLQNLFGIEKVPCDTYIRERLDETDPNSIRGVFKNIFSLLQKGKQLEKYVFLNGKYLLLKNNIEVFSSKKVHCKNCCEKHHNKDCSVTYYNPILGAAIVHPDYKEVIPLCPEPTIKKNDTTKNDHKKNASERLLRNFKKEHPHLSIILVENTSNESHLKLLEELNISFISAVRQEGNKYLFEYVNSSSWEQDMTNKNIAHGEYSFIDDIGHLNKFRFINQIPPNNSHLNLKVNFLEYWEIDEKEKVIYHNTWITDILLTQDNVYKIAKGGRSRWQIENETLHTLKNQGYGFEHNFGHGYKNLSTVFAMLMMLAFLIDQIEQANCGLFQEALKAVGFKKSRFWNRLRNFFGFYIVPSWEILYQAIKEPAKYVKKINIQ